LQHAGRRTKKEAEGSADFKIRFRVVHLQWNAPRETYQEKRRFTKKGGKTKTSGKTERVRAALEVLSPGRPIRGQRGK